MMLLLNLYYNHYLRSFHQYLNRLVEFFNCICVTCFDGVDDAVVNVVFEDDFAGAVNSGPDSGELDEDFRAVPAVFHHTFDGGEVTDTFRKSVQHSL